MYLGACVIARASRPIGREPGAVDALNAPLVVEGTLPSMDNRMQRCVLLAPSSTVSAPVLPNKTWLASGTAVCRWDNGRSADSLRNSATSSTRRRAAGCRMLATYALVRHDPADISAAAAWFASDIARLVAGAQISAEAGSLV